MRQVASEATMKMVPGRNSGCTLAETSVPKMFGQLTVHACSQPPNGSSRMRVSSSSAATSTYGDQALARPIEPLSCATSRGWMEPVQSAGQFSRLRSNSQHSSGLGTRNPRARGRHDDGQPHQAAQQRRELRAQQVGRRHVGQRHRERREERELPDLQALGQRSFRAEEAGHGRDQDQRHQRAGHRVQDRHAQADEREEVELHSPKPRCAAYAAMAGSADSPVLTPTRIGVPAAPKLTGVLWMIMPAMTAAMPGKPRPDQQRHGHRGGRAEAGRALDERSEQPGDHDDLHPAVGRDAP